MLHAGGVLLNPLAMFVRVYRGSMVTLVLGRSELWHLAFMCVDRPPIPTDDRRPAWRRACLTYRELRDAGASDQEAHEAAVAAVQTLLPLSYQEASVEGGNAVAYGFRCTTIAAAPIRSS